MKQVTKKQFKTWADQLYRSDVEQIEGTFMGILADLGYSLVEENDCDFMNDSLETGDGLLRDLNISKGEPRRVTREIVNQRLPGCTCDSAYKDRGLIDHECHHHAIWDYLPALLADLGLELAADTPAQEKSCKK